MPASRAFSASRRHVVLGALAAPLAVATVGVTVTAVATAAPAAASEPECLADLIESGEVTRADLVAR